MDAQTDRIRLSADVGGTFTDIAAFNERTGEFSLGKTLTTPARLVDGIETGVTTAVRVRPHEGRPVGVDLSKVPKPVVAFYNSGETAGRLSCRVAFKCLTPPRARSADQ